VFFGSVFHISTDHCEAMCTVTALLYPDGVLGDKILMRSNQIGKSLFDAYGGHHSNS
jgi:hypothetical protein